MLFTGRLTADAEVQTIKDGKKVTKFTVALNKRFKTKAGEKREQTAFVRCAYWVNPALEEYLTKGSIVEISGWMEAEAWVNNEGKAQANLTCNVDNVKLFGSGAVTKAEAKPKARNAVKDAVGTDADEDDLPF